MLSLFTVGYFCTALSTRLSRNIYESKKTNLERILKRNLNKNFDLGEFSDLRFLGFSVLKTKIEDIEIPDSKIEAENMYVRFMPIRSFLNREWVFSLNPNKLKVDIREDFFLRRKKIINLSKRIKRRFNYEVHLNLKNNSILNINNLDIKGNFRGNLIYRSSRNQLITFLNTNLKEKGNLKLKINRKFSNQFLSLNLKTNDLNLKDIKYKLINEELKFNKGSIKSNFKFIKSPDKNYCKGNISISNVNLVNTKLKENIISKSFSFDCIDNKLIIKGNDLNYGTLISNLDLDIPLYNGKNDIIFNGKIGFKKYPNVAKLNGKLPYFLNNKGINFGELNAKINLERTKLDNLNIFRNNGISGFITAVGNLSGNIKDINTFIDFDIEYPTYKGVRIKETFDGKIENQDNGYLLELTPRESVVPTYINIEFDKNLKLDKLNIERTLFPGTPGNLNIFKKNNYYQWEANKLNLKKLEFSILDNKDFEWVEGEITGSGFVSRDLSDFNGNILLKNGEYRKLNFAESNIKLDQKGKSLKLESILKTKDGGIIEIIYKSDEYDFIKAKLKNISSGWTAITAFDLVDFRDTITSAFDLDDLKEKKLKENKINKKSIKKQLFKDVEIKNNQKTLDERIKFFNNFIANRKVSNKDRRLNDFLEKFDGRYSGVLNISGTDSKNYAIKAKVEGILNEKNSLDNNFKNNFSAYLTGGLLENKGKLIVQKLPLRLANLFFNESKKFKGNLTFDLDYDLNKNSFSSKVSFDNASINDFSMNFDKGEISLFDSSLNLDLSLVLNQSRNPITFKGSIPLKKNKELDLRLRADETIFDLYEKLYGKNFIFKTGDINFGIKFSGPFNRPEANGYLSIDNGSFDIFANSLEETDALLIFDFDKVEIVKFKANGSKSGEINIKGSLPFYESLGDEKNSIEFFSNNFNLMDRNINFLFDGNILIGGSFLAPDVGGNIGLNNGYIEFKGNQNAQNQAKNDKDQNLELWPELYWNKKKDIEIISNESILNKNLFDKNLPLVLNNIKFNNLKLNIGPEFRMVYGNILEAYLESKGDIYLNGNLKNDLTARGLILIKRGKANLYTTPFKLDKNNFNHMLFASRNALNPYLDFALTSKVPDAIIPISENNKDINISEDNDFLENNNNFGSFGIGNTRFIKIDASYKGFLDQLSFEDQNQKIKLRSTPGYSRSQIIGLIGGNSANIINRAFTSQLSGSNGFNERFQLSIYPALIENNESINNIFSNENIDINDDNDANDQNSANDGSSSQAWIAELSLDITDSLNFAIQTTPDREDIPPLWILTLQPHPILELLGSYDSNGDWKSQLQLFFRY